MAEQIRQPQRDAFASECSDLTGRGSYLRSDGSAQLRKAKQNQYFSWLCWRRRSPRESAIFSTILEIFNSYPHFIPRGRRALPVALACVVAAGCIATAIIWPPRCS